MIIHGAMSESNIKKLLRNQKLQKYINKEADEIYKRERKKNKNLTIDVPYDLSTNLKIGLNAPSDIFHNPNYIDNRSEDYYSFKTKYRFFISYDTDHIQKMTLILFDKATEKPKHFTITPPSKEELGFYNE